VTLTANPTPSVVVTLPAGRFTQAPRVQLTPNSSLWMPAMISGSVTATSFALIARNILATTGTGTADVHWLATQATSAATDG
jgi:hypothetical protein